MIENPKLEKMGLDYPSSNCEDGELEEKGAQKISISDHVNGAQRSDSFVVDMECFSHLVETDINKNSRITLQRNVSRKGSVTGDNKKINPTTANQRNASILATSPTATLHGGVTPEKPAVATLGPTDRSASPKHHHQITIKNGGLGSSATESKRGGDRLGFRHSPPTWSTDPRRILMFFATLSSLGTILLIYFTLSMGKLDNDLN